VRLAVCAIFKDEAPYLAEWIHFHIAQGVERFYLYDNNSTDDWVTALKPYEDVVEVTHWPHESGQLVAYRDCFLKHRLDTRWLAVIDVDEFLFSPTGDGLLEVLDRFPPCASVAANWRTYGTSGHIEPPDGGVLPSYRYRTPDTHPVNRHIKSIVFPALVVIFSNSHHFVGMGPTLGESGDLVEAPWREPPTANLLRINHYYTRSLLEFDAKFEAKSNRARVNGAAQPERPNHDEFNAVYDPILADPSGRLS
jgi:hypothetical protein